MKRRLQLRKNGTRSSHLRRGGRAAVGGRRTQRRRTGGSQALHPFSSQLSRAALYAAKLIWCNPTTADGVLEGIKLPMQTAIGLPVWNGNGAAGVFLLYSLTRCEQTPNMKKGIEEPRCAILYQTDKSLVRKPESLEMRTLISC